MSSPKPRAERDQPEKAIIDQDHLRGILEDASIDGAIAKLEPEPAEQRTLARRVQNKDNSFEGLLEKKADDISSINDRRQ